MLEDLFLEQGLTAINEHSRAFTFERVNRKSDIDDTRNGCFVPPGGLSSTGK